MRGTGSFDWTVEDLFVPERRVMPHVGAPLDNQWAHWPGITYAMPSFAWVGPHHCSVLTGIARAGIDALIELAGEKCRVAARVRHCCATALRCRRRWGGRTRCSTPGGSIAPRRSANYGTR